MITTKVNIRSENLPIAYSRMQSSNTLDIKFKYLNWKLMRHEISHQLRYHIY